MPRFDRAYSLIVGKGGSTGVEINSLRINFDIQKDEKKKPNSGSIQVWNLKESTRAALEKPGTRCVLKAGYAEEGGPIEIFQGDVVFAWTKFDKADVITTLELGEGATTYRDTMLSLGYPPGVTSTTALRDIAGWMGLALSIPSDAPSRTWPGGLTFHGPARTALDKVTAGTGLSWSIQAGSLQVTRLGGTTNRTVIRLSSTGGMVGSPERQRQGPQSTARVRDENTGRRREVKTPKNAFDGWRVRSLLMPYVLPGDRVQLSARAANGVLKVHSIRHFGDSHSGDWITELKLIDPTTAPTDRRGQRPRASTDVRQSNAGGNR